MKVVGKYKTVYECDISGKQKDGEGTSYPVKGTSGKRAKLLDKGFCTREKEQAMNGVLTGETEWYGPQILDIAYSHGKFIGYIYEEEASGPESNPAVPELDPANDENHRFEPSHSSDFGFLSRWLKPIYTLIIGIVLTLLTYSVFFDLYLRVVEGVGGQNLADYCYTFNFSGITGIIGGIAAMLLAARVLYRGAVAVYCVMLPVAYLVGMAAVFLVVALVIALLQFAYALFIALLPSLIIIGAIVYLIRNVFKR